MRFTAGPSESERKKQAKERRKAERARQQQQRRAYEQAQRERERAYWSRFHSGNGGGSSSGFAPRAGISAQDKAMALDMINAGYRALSRKHHPDAGGSHEKMVEVNRALEALRKVVG